MPSKLIDFADLKRQFPILEVAEYLGLVLKPEGPRHRGICPYCDDKRGFAITPAGGKDGLGMSGCFKCGNSKDSIGLVMHFKGIANPREAAEFIINTFGTNTVPATGNSNVPEARNSTVPDEGNSTVPPPAAAPPQPAPPQASPTDNRLEKVAARLLHEHAEVQALGLSPKAAEELGIGYDVRGMLKGRVLFPLYRDEVLVGFVGYAADLEPALKLPSNLTDAAAPTATVHKFPRAV